MTDARDVIVAIDCDREQLRRSLEQAHEAIQSCDDALLAYMTASTVEDVRRVTGRPE